MESIVCQLCIGNKYALNFPSIYCSCGTPWHVQCLQEHRESVLSQKTIIELYNNTGLFFLCDHCHEEYQFKNEPTALQIYLGSLRVYFLTVCIPFMIFVILTEDKKNYMIFLFVVLALFFIQLKKTLIRIIISISIPEPKLIE